MNKKVTRTFWVDGIDLVKIRGEHFIPTALHYPERNVRPNFGSAVYGEKIAGQIVNRNFKVELGNVIPGGSFENRLRFSTEEAGEKTAYELTKDFFDSILNEIESGDLAADPKNERVKIIVAEPLSFQMEGYGNQWIKNYRSNLKRILNKYVDVDFLPEPFAVYQFYRYGLRIHKLQDNISNIALILDFGGGTFDCCVIKSAKTGDVSQTGKHSKPLSAASLPIGGFVINQRLAEYLIKRDVENGGERKNRDTHIKRYQKFKKGSLELSELSQKNQAFIHNMAKLEEAIESCKINLVNKITSWSLVDESYFKQEIELPVDPYSFDTKWYASHLIGHQFRHVFLHEIWEKGLKRAITQVIKTATSELKGECLTITLISGGSSNIRWLEKLLIKDFSIELSEAKPFSMSQSFQEVVAKGLAIECARRFYDPESEFVSVSYNPVRLLLNPDGKGLEQPGYRSLKDDIDMSKAVIGDLIPAAQALKSFVDGSPLQWRFRLKHPPKGHLEYYFTKYKNSSLEEDVLDIDNVFNVDRVLHTKQGALFDSKMRVELTIQEDGTVHPKFIYKSGNAEHNIPECSELGKPFVIDMTADQPNPRADRYIGFDFGTSNSSICLLEQEGIGTVENRSSQSGWLALKDALPDLPYVVSAPIRRYLSVTNPELSVGCARDAFEAALAFAAYTAAMEAKCLGWKSNALETFAHRSMGPLKELLEKSLNFLGDNANFSLGFKKLFSDYSAELNSAMSEFNNHKHKKLNASSVLANDHLTMISNVLVKSLEGKLFGFFENVERKKYSKDSYQGIFRVAHASQPFIEIRSYVGKTAFDSAAAMLYDEETQRVLSLMPMIFWGEPTESSHTYPCFLFDMSNKDGCIVKSVDDDKSLLVNDISDELAEFMKAVIIRDEYDGEIIHIDSLDERGDE